MDKFPKGADSAEDDRMDDVSTEPVVQRPADSFADEAGSRNSAPRGERNLRSASESSESHLPRQNDLFVSGEIDQIRSRWDQVQGSFVDEPRSAVEQADSLVADVVRRIMERFSSERQQLEKQWSRGEDANTEDLRQTFRSYRTFFDRLLSFNDDQGVSVRAETSSHGPQTTASI